MEILAVSGSLLRGNQQVCTVKSAALGGTHCCVEVSDTDYCGADLAVLPSVSFRPLETCTHTRRSGFTRHIPEAGAVCGNSARTDLCGGRG